MTEAPPPQRKRLNAEQKRALKAGALHRFVKAYGRRGATNGEPNDRTFDRKIQRTVKRMKPGDLDQFLREEEE
jgi:hypothetical protein